MGQVLVEISLQITADKKLRCTPPKLLLATSFIHKILSEILNLAFLKGRLKK